MHAVAQKTDEQLDSDDDDWLTPEQRARKQFKQVLEREKVIIEVLSTLFQTTDDFYTEFDANQYIKVDPDRYKDLKQATLPLGNARLKYVLALYQIWKRLVRSVEV